jgi:purine-nucleoside phosphorylase
MRRRTALFPEIRIASASDIPAIIEIEARSFPLPWDLKTISACVGSSFFRTWTSRLADSVTGYVTAELDENRLHIVNLAVDSAFRRSGHASCLLRAAESWGKRLGADVSILEVRDSALPAKGLYMQCGYRCSRLLESYYPDGENGLEYMKGIDPDRITSAVARKIACLGQSVPSVGVILGSGLSWLSDGFGSLLDVRFSDLLGESGPEIPGHPGKVSFSGCGRFIFLLGRFHHYQGYTGDEISLLPGVLGDLGVTSWILTTSSGAVDTDLRPGDAVLFEDHVNFSGCIPEGITGRIRKSVYSRRLKNAARDAARRTGTDLGEGVFASVSGPAYETSAEIEFLGDHGFSTVSMSTVPEALFLSSRGLDVAAVSLVTNAASPGSVLTHEEVLSSQADVRRKQEAFLSSFLREAAADEV